LARNGGVAHELGVRARTDQNFWMIVTPLGGVDTYPTAPIVRLTNPTTWASVDHRFGGLSASRKAFLVQVDSYLLGVIPITLLRNVSRAAALSTGTSLTDPLNTLSPR